MIRQRVLILASDAFGGFGGIAKFNRDFVYALDSSSLVEAVLVLPRVISEEVSAVPDSVILDRQAARGAFSFLKRALTVGLSFPADIVICGHINLLPIARIAASLKSVPLVLVIHGIEAWEPSRRRLTNVSCSGIDHVVSVSRYTASRFILWSKVNDKKVTIIPNLVDLERFRPGKRSLELTRRYNIGNSKVLLTVGRLSSQERHKGFDEVLDALPELVAKHDLKYLIVGDGSDKARLESKAASLGLASVVIFAGRVSEVEKIDHYNLADAYVMPSIGEGFGIVLIEAAACGVPIIGSKIDGSFEALQGGRLGRLIDPRSRAELVQAVDQVITQPPARVRNPSVKKFGVEMFRKRVNEWISKTTSAR